MPEISASSTLLSDYHDILTVVKGGFRNPLNMHCLIFERLMKTHDGSKRHLISIDHFSQEQHQSSAQQEQRQKWR